MTFQKTKPFWHKTFEYIFFNSYRYSKMAIENAIYKCISCVQFVHIVHSGAREFIPGFSWDLCSSYYSFLCSVSYTFFSLSFYPFRVAILLSVF